jgi:hypothetical protein
MNECWYFIHFLGKLNWDWQGYLVKTRMEEKSGIKASSSRSRKTALWKAFPDAVRIVVPIATTGMTTSIFPSQVMGQIVHRP